jgi:excisionase family DNA binding protein
LVEEQMTDSLENEEFLTVAEVATLLKVNEQTVRNWIDRGELPAVRAGRRVRIRRSALEQVLTEVSGARPAPEPVPAGPSGDDFWGGVAVGTADLPAGPALNG